MAEAKTKIRKRNVFVLYFNFLFVIYSHLFVLSALCVSLNVIQ